MPGCRQALDAGKPSMPGCRQALDAGKPSMPKNVAKMASPVTENVAKMAR